ncbi:crotonobetaine/carnitine-CoA ligase [Rhizobium leguminosarum]
MLEPLEVLELYPQHDNTLKGLFDSRASIGPHRPLLGFGQTDYSWQTFARTVELAAAMLHTRGVGKGDRVAIVATNSDAHVILLFALSRLGAAMVPLNPNFGVAELSYILSHSDVRGVLVTEATLPTVQTALDQRNFRPWLLRLDGAENGANWFDGAVSEVHAPVHGEPDDTCLIIYTSGTTGLPKGVMHSQRNYVTCAEVASGRTAVQPDDKVLIILPFFHVNALFYSLGSIFAAGASGVILPRFSASTFWDSVVQTRATHVNIIEAVGNILQKRPREEFRPQHRLRVVYGVRAAFVRTFHDEFGIPTLVTGFGMTECPGVLCNPLRGPEKPGSVGILGSHPDTSRPSTRARVVDDEGNDIPNGQVGELWLDSPTLMQGYFRDEVHTKAAFRDGWFMTGDLVRRDDDGYFYFVSRKKDIIRRRGENISGAELDRVIGEHPGVYEAAAIAVPAELGEDEILAAVVLKKDVELQAGDIASWCREHLAPMKVPRYVLFLDELPHTATHKVAKAQLRADPSLRERATDLERPS